MTKLLSTILHWMLMSSCLTLSVQGRQRRNNNNALRRGLQTPVDVGMITHLRLINADTDQPIPPYDPLNVTTRIDLATINTTNLNVEAITAGGGNVTSILWEYNGVRRYEENPLWTMCGNRDLDFLVCPQLKTGANVTITAKPYSGKSGTGQPGVGRSVTLFLYTSNNSTTPPPPVSKNMTMTLINADTDVEIGPLLNGMTIDIGATPNINIRANVDAASVKFVATNGSSNGVTILSRIENSAPFAYNGNDGTNYYPWSPTIGQYTVIASAHSEKNAQGLLWSTISVSFQIVNGTISNRTTAPTGNPAKSTSAPIVIGNRTSAPVSIPAPARAPVAPSLPMPTTNAAPITAPSDTTPPKLLSFNVSTARVDLSDGPVEVEVQLVAQDDGSGFAKSIVSYESNAFSYSKFFTPNFPTAGGVVVPFKIIFNFTDIVPSDEYEFTVYLVDQASMFVYFRGNDLARLGFASRIEVNNPVLP